MASILRQIVASPRARHPEAGLDLCYVTDNIIATSGPGATYPQVAYRNPLKDLVSFLDSKHGDKWAIWEFKAEGTGYPDSEVYGRIRHYPWPDHHPPPFALIPLIMGSMRNWLKDKDVEGRVVVVHCKAGKGRSGTISCSYLISEEGWTSEDAVQRFTERRMRPGFGVGISIPSQQRWIRYVERWVRHGKKYVERPVEVLELHVWGLRDGVKIGVQGFADEGKVIKTFHTFHSSERKVVRGGLLNENGFADVAMEALGRKKTVNDIDDKSEPANGDEKLTFTRSDGSPPADSDVIFRPSSKIVLPSNDMNIDFERRNKSKFGGFSMVTSVAHVWFNTFFEGQGPETGGTPDDSGVFEIEWDAMDGLKGSSRKGTRAFDKIAVVWKAVDASRKSSTVVDEPKEGEEVKQTQPADWRGEDGSSTVLQKLGLRANNSGSESVSRASSVQSKNDGDDWNGSEEELQGVKSDVVGDTASDQQLASSSQHTESDTQAGNVDNLPTIKVHDVDDDLAHGMDDLSTSNLPEGGHAAELKDREEHSIASTDKGRG